MVCLCCGAVDGVELESSRTAYQFEELCMHTDCLPNASDTPEQGTARTELRRLCLADRLTSQPDPNAPIPLCRPCAAEHHAEWDERWADYYAGLLLL